MPVAELVGEVQRGEPGGTAGGPRARVPRPEHGRRGDTDGGRDEQEPGPVGASASPASRSHASGVTRSPRPSTSAGPPARKNGTSEPRPAAPAGAPRRRAPRPRPRARRPPPRRRRTTRRRGRPRPGSASPAGRRAAAAARARPHAGPRGRAGRGDRAQDEVVGRRTRGRTRSTWSVSSPRRQRRPPRAGRRDRAGPSRCGASW